MLLIQEGRAATVLHWDVVEIKLQRHHGAIPCTISMRPSEAAVVMGTKLLPEKFNSYFIYIYIHISNIFNPHVFNIHTYMYINVVNRLELRAGRVAENP